MSDFRRDTRAQEEHARRATNAALPHSGLGRAQVLFSRLLPRRRQEPAAHAHDDARHYGHIFPRLYYFDAI